MEGSEEGDDMLPAGVIAGQLHRALDGLRAGVSIVEAVRTRHRRNCGEPFRKRNHVFVIEVGAGDVNQLGCLTLDGFDDFGVAMSGRDDGNSRGEVEEFVAIYILYTQTA